MNLRLLLFGIFLGALGCDAQPAVCSLSGQAAEAAFDPSLVEFVTNPKPIGNAPGASFQMIARVVGVSPLTVEILDTDTRDQSGQKTCARKRII